MLTTAAATATTTATAAVVVVGRMLGRVCRYDFFGATNSGRGFRVGLIETQRIAEVETAPVSLYSCPACAAVKNGQTTKYGEIFRRCGGG